MDRSGINEHSVAEDGMTETESYLFDLRGYLVVKNALTQEQVADLSDRLEKRRTTGSGSSGRTARGIRRAKAPRSRPSR